MEHRKGGFTLIELLVVIAIIGILSAVVLASLTTARQKGSDSAARADLIGTRAQSELFYYANANSYAGVCAVAAASNGTKSINAQVLAAAVAEGIGNINITYTTAGTNSTVTCHDTALGWGAEVPLKIPVPGTTMFCVDSTGYAATTSGSTLGVSDIACG